MPKDGGKSTSTSSTGATSPPSGMSDRQVRDEVMTIFIAGHETTANALTWTFYLLSQNPNIEERLLYELRTVIDNNRTPTVYDIPKLKFTDKILRESMRLYPPVWSMGRYVECIMTHATIVSQSGLIPSDGVRKQNLYFPDLVISHSVEEFEAA
jgi:cytochrome P450